MNELPEIIANNVKITSFPLTDTMTVKQFKMNMNQISEDAFDELWDRIEEEFTPKSTENIMAVVAEFLGFTNEDKQLEELEADIKEILLGSDDVL